METFEDNSEIGLRIRKWPAILGCAVALTGAAFILSGESQNKIQEYQTVTECTANDTCAIYPEPNPKTLEHEIHTEDHKAFELKMAALAIIVTGLVHSEYKSIRRNRKTQAPSNLDTVTSELEPYLVQPSLTAAQNLTEPN